VRVSGIAKLVRKRGGSTARRFYRRRKIVSPGVV
jgi:hypothetical protein